MIAKTKKPYPLRNPAMHVITAGTGDNFIIIGIVRGPRDPYISTLWGNFRRQYGIPTEKDGGMLETTSTLAVIRKRQEYGNSILTAQQNLVKDGYQDADFEVKQFHSIPGLFIDWLVKHHRYIRIPKKEFHISV